MGLRQQFNSKAMPLALAIPWIISMLISWIPFIKVSLYEVPRFLLLAGLISTVEVLSIVAVFIYTTIFPESSYAEPAEPGCASTWKEKFFLAWSWFLFISPFCTSIFVVWMTSDISCNYDDDDYTILDQPICQVGIRLIKATALFRAGIIAIFLFATSSWLESRRPQCDKFQQDQSWPGSPNTAV
ncbi:hypothetical protein DER46DRAFT_491515 [Fusarium sp. MPI-SDFR-AT-0072]|nr:hypothetical protein DER46DRAFT_491515 [Fusarium sp. MPI-SDFR-AT-0072]